MTGKNSYKNIYGNCDLLTLKLIFYFLKMLSVYQTTPEGFELRIIVDKLRNQNQDF